MRVQAITAAALLLGACTTTDYLFTPPESPEGKACVERCQASQTGCRSDQDARAGRIQARCEAGAGRRELMCQVQAPVEYAACLKFARNDEERAACALEDCTQPACDTAPDYVLCENDFRFCYQNCGGRIDIIER